MLAVGFGVYSRGYGRGVFGVISPVRVHGLGFREVSEDFQV